MMEHPALEIRSGGQSGVDRAALDVAATSSLRSSGWCPRGGWAEDRRDPPGVRALYPQLVETPSSDPRQRTAWNVRDSDATLLITRAGVESPGTDFTRECAELIFSKPHYVADLDSPRVEDLRAWLEALRARSGGKRFVLNVAGPRESESPGIHHGAVAFLSDLLGSPTGRGSAP